MNYFTLLSSYPDHTIASAWYSQIRAANKTPWLAAALTGCGDELFERFAACYAELRTLPRSARRTLQRQLARSREMASILPEHLQGGGRKLQQRMAWSLAGAALLLALGQQAATAATVTVTTSNPNIAADGQCSLIEAIVNANNDAATHPDCAAGSGADTIVLPANANITILNANGTNQYNWSIGLPLITSQITIQGNGATIRRPGNAQEFGLMSVLYPGDLTLESVTLSGGSSAQGGAVFNSGTVTIKNSTISGNTTSFNGGGLYSYYGDLTIENSTISRNTAEVDGGGVHHRYGSLTITNSTITGNRANHGGGVYQLSNFTSDSLTLNNSVIAGNQAPFAPEIEYKSKFSRDIVNSNHFNLFGTNGNAGITGFTPGPTDIVPAPGFQIANILGPLKNNGGPTRTHGLVVGSLAIDAGDPSGCRSSTGALLLTDQRGFNRHVDGNHDGTARCDIGAVEGLGFASPADFDGDAKGDIGIYRSGAWLLLRSANGAVTATQFGGGSDLAVPADFDGDGKIDIAVYRNGSWITLRSSDGAVTATQFGGGSDLPVPADFDGDGKTDLAVYRNGSWIILRSSDGAVTSTQFGGGSDLPVPADFDGDGTTDIAVYRDGLWIVLRSSDGTATATRFGGGSDLPVPADYDGDGKADIAVYRDGSWIVLRSSDGTTTATQFGGGSDLPVPADYDGDGKADIAVYRDGSWIILRSSDGAVTATQFGGGSDIPLN